METRTRRFALVAVIGTLCAGMIWGMSTLIDCGAERLGAPDGEWHLQAQFLGPRIAPPGHALMLHIESTQEVAFAAKDAQDREVPVHCHGLPGGETCWLPPWVVQWTASTSARCHGGDLRKTNTGWVCDAPSDEHLVVRTEPRAAWVTSTSLERALVLPPAFPGDTGNYSYSSLGVDVVDATGHLDLDVHFHMRKPGDDESSGTRWGLARGPSNADGPRVFTLSLGDISRWGGDAIVVADARGFMLCDTDEPCVAPTTPVLQLQSLRVVLP